MGLNEMQKEWFTKRFEKAVKITGNVRKAYLDYFGIDANKVCVTDAQIANGLMRFWLSGKCYYGENEDDLDGYEMTVDGPVFVSSLRKNDDVRIEPCDEFYKLFNLLSAINDEIQHPQKTNL
jgi:hypothetical protein